MTDKEELITKQTEENITETESEEFMKAAALAYAKYLKAHGLEPGDVSFADVSEFGLEEFEKPAEEEASADLKSDNKEEGQKKADKEKKTPEPLLEQIDTIYKRDPNAEPAEKSKSKKKDSEHRTEVVVRNRKRRKAHDKLRDEFLKQKEVNDPISSLITLHDRVQDKCDEIAANVGREFAKGAHRIASTYRNTRRSIGRGILVIGLLAAILLVVFDRYTVYEYAYNGKTLGYVTEQEEVTDVLDVAGRKLTQNSKNGAKVEFVANQNVTFNPVDGRGKSTDDGDIAVNKLIYMTDIETEGYGVFDGSELKAIVKDQKDAEELLAQTKDELSRPDEGMRLVSSEFTNTLEIKTVDVLLGSVQSNQAARRQMIDGGLMEVYHIVDSDDMDIPDISDTDTEEEIQSKRISRLAETFGVDASGVYDADNQDVVTEIEQGDVVCIRTEVEPVSVKMVETGRIKETIEFETIKKKSDKYYQGDTYVEQEGEDGVQIFEGTITKVGGEETKRKEVSTEVIREKKDKIILVGTKERPKTAPTGTFQMPIKHYVVTSEFGGRWGRMHEGMDYGAATGTPIYAADGGTVVRAEYYSGYGLCVDIDHENGKMTRYGHCSRLLVRRGDKVYQGQEIAKVGNTGNSFGSHLHFEVRINGTAQNPRKFVNP